MRGYGGHILLNLSTNLRTDLTDSYLQGQNGPEINFKKVIISLFLTFSKS